ncbi:hypothetical protein OG552_19200 [Streptomyces sp. NBC_01476]|uniref:hypothetical protein n=1 Tax=Streptomyces sp. NBC_01476 TaxID=2903881 RepID=UPI002E346B83|nr:hypothetical protein [Streptomyces sp. NBC_01476]
MGWTLTRRATASAALAGAIALVSTVLPAAYAGTRTGGARPVATAATAAATPPSTPAPLPPRLPRDFHGKGTWVVRDLGVTVPFTWNGRDGDSQMIAGGPQYPIWFTNLIYHGTLYTLTYKWPGLTEHPCSQIPGFDLDQLNQALQGARFVGREILQQNPNRYVNHWRVGAVLPKLPPGKFLRFPLALGDIYVDQNDRSTFWQVLQFGIQNLYDPELDEWLVMDTFEHKPGTVTLPQSCAPPPA